MRRNEHSERRGMDEDWLRGRFEMLLSAQAEFNREFAHNGRVSETTHAEFETEMLHMHNALEHHSDHDAAGDIWEEFAMSEIPNICSRTQRVERQRVGDFGIKKTEEDTVVRRAPAEYLNKWTLGFKRVMNELGLLTSVEKESGELYAIKRDPEDYEDPITDDIEKPQ